MPSSAALPTERYRGAALGGIGTILAAVLGSAACSTTPPARAALSADLPALKAAVAEAERSGKLDRDGTLELARAVFERELSSLPDPVTEFPDTRGCAEHVSDALARVARGSNDASELASLALMDAGLSVPDSSGGDNGEIRAARRAVGVPAGPRRRAFMLHGDAAVRRAALWAAEESRDPADAAALLEAARLDPDAKAREIAFEALGVLGGPRVVLGLRDLWPSADRGRRRAIIAAWSAPACASAGGVDELSRVAEAAGGVDAVMAAVALSHMRSGPPGLATAVLLAALESEDVLARLWAIYAAPWQEPAIRPALERQAQSPDDATRVLALLRAIENGSADAAKMAELRKLSAAPAAPPALIARAVLARAGDGSVVPALRADLSAPRASQRTLAALGLVLLEQWGAAAHALADDSPRVRQAVACQLLGFEDGETNVEVLRGRAFGPWAPEIATFLLAPEN